MKRVTREEFYRVVDDTTGTVLYETVDYDDVCDWMEEHMRELDLMNTYFEFHPSNSPVEWCSLQDIVDEQPRGSMFDDLRFFK